MSCGRKEFGSKNDALKALEVSKSKVTEIMHKARNMSLNQFKKSVGRQVKEDHIVASMPRIRISAAKNQLTSNTFIGATKRNFFGNGKDAENLLSGLTPGNLSKISAADKDSRVASAIQDHKNLSLANAHLSQDSDKESPPPRKERRNFARGISLQIGDRTQNSQLRNLSAIAPSAHHRFDKESVHLRSMYRQLYPGTNVPSTNTSRMAN